MPVSVVEQVQSTSIAVATTIGSAQGLTLATTPVAGDVILVVIKTLGVNNPAVVSVTGLGATWANAYTGTRISFWMGTGATSSGSPTVTLGNGDAQATVYNIRGLTSTTVAGVSANTATVTAQTGVSQTVDAGQIVVAAAAAASSSSGVTLTYPSSQTPSGWTTASTVASSIGRAGDAYRIPTSSAAHTTSSTSSVNATMEIASVAIGPATSPSDARLDAVHLQALVSGVSDARLDQVSVQALIAGASEARLDQVNVQFLLPFKMDVYLDATSFEVLIPVEHVDATAEPVWIPATLPAAPTLVWLPDAPASLELPSEGAWGVIVAINH